MFGWGKKKPETSFKDRITQFWDWYPTVSERFFQSIEAGRCEDLTQEVSQATEFMLPTMAWVFGPGENGGHSFTVSGEGYLPKQLLAEYWHSRAVELPHWTFHASRQPSEEENLKNMAIGIGEHDSIDTESFLISTNVDDEAQRIHITAWHPLLERLPEEHHYQILFILLDEALGEFGTQTWLGEIQIEPITPDDKTKTIATLPAFIKQVENYHQWEKTPPLRSYSLYEVPEQTDNRRGDTLIGTTCIPDIVIDFLENGGRLSEDPLPDTGAEFAYVAVDGSVFPDGQQSDVRANIEDALDEALISHLSGRALGGAFGFQESYIDLLLLDGDNSRAIVQAALGDLQLTNRSRIESFL